ICWIAAPFSTVCSDGKERMDNENRNCLIMTKMRRRFAYRMREVSETEFFAKRFCGLKDNCL
ncbi:MAG: hypothetical protein LBP40_05840, partial [Campylobacteraceae bacterium]|nr:hypothetical protein [Campylobacteraceae bacterium]